MGKKKIYGIKREIIFMAIALIIMGIVFVIFPAASAVTICYIIVAALCVWGDYKTCRIFQNQPVQHIRFLRACAGSSPYSRRHIHIHKT